MDFATPKDLYEKRPLPYMVLENQLVVASIHSKSMGTNSTHLELLQGALDEFVTDVRRKTMCNRVLIAGDFNYDGPGDIVNAAGLSYETGTQATQILGGILDYCVFTKNITVAYLQQQMGSADHCAVTFEVTV
jgi:hypothetical protein